MAAALPPSPFATASPVRRPRRARPRPLLSVALQAALAAGLAAPAGAAEAAAAPTEVSTVAGPLDGAVGGVAVDALGVIYVADFGSKVWKVSPWGEVEVFADTLYGTSGNAVDPEGNLLQSSFYADTLSRIGRDGSVTTVARGLAGPVGVTVNTDGQIYVCNCRSNVVSRISAAGEVTDFASGDLFNCPNGLTHDADGNLYVVNFRDGRLIEIDPSGAASPVATIPGGGNGHVVAVGTDLYVTGFRANRIFRVSTSAAGAEVTPVAGTGAFGENDGPAGEATFSTPNGIAYDPRRDALYTNDYLQTFDERFAGRTRPRSTLRQILFPTLEQVAEAAFAGGGPGAGKEALRSYVAARSGKPWEVILNLFGYRLLGGGRLAEATAVFELNTDLFPKSFNAWDSLAEANKAAGHRERAIELYRKSLALNPANANATAMLRELGAE